MQKRIVTLLFATLTLDMIGIGMVYPIIPILFTDPSSHSFILHGYTRQAQFLLAGAITAIASIAQFFAAPIIGELSDTYGRKKILLIGVSALTLGQIIFGLGIYMASVPLLFVSRIIAGLGSANASIAQACIADITHPDDRARRFGIISSAFGLGFIIGPIIGGTISAYTGDPASPFWFAAILGLLNLFFVSLFMTETGARTTRAASLRLLKGVHNIRQAFSDPSTRSVYITIFWYASGFAFITSFAGVFLAARFDVSEAHIGIFYAVVAGWAVLAQIYILPRFSQYFIEQPIINTSMLVLALVCAIQPAVPSIFVEYLLTPALAIPYALAGTNLLLLVSKKAPDEKQGVALGIQTSIQALAQGMIPLVAGTFAAMGGVSAPFYAAAGCAIAGYITLRKTGKVDTRE